MDVAYPISAFEHRLMVKGFFMTLGFCAGALSTSHYIRPRCKSCLERHPHHPEAYICKGPSMLRQRKPGWFHRHQWVIAQDHGIGVYQKQHGQTRSKVYCSGKIEKCFSCPAMRVVPHNDQLKPMEIVEQIA